ncbi:MAG: transposase [Bacteroidia bacterium]|nr:transposase [Bacteroidia bacterium]
MVREIKKASSRFVKEERLCQFNFSWQEGFGAFSYSQSSISKVITYILNQKEHHQRKTFRQEYKETLEKFKIDYQEEYLPITD